MVKKQTNNTKMYSILFNFYSCCNKWKLPKTEQSSSITFPVNFEAFLVISGMLLKHHRMWEGWNSTWNAVMAAKQTSFSKGHRFMLSTKNREGWVGVDGGFQNFPGNFANSCEWCLERMFFFFTPWMSTYAESFNFLAF